MTALERLGVPFVLSLIGGLLIFLSSAISIVLFAVGSAPFGPYWGMMGDFHGMTGTFGLPYSYMTAFSAVGLICGVIVVIGAFMFNTRPSERMSWGILVLIFSAVSLISMGGWFIGALLGIAGGALAISWKPR